MFNRSPGPYIIASDGSAKRTNILGVPDQAGSGGTPLGEMISRTTTNSSEISNTVTETNLLSFTLSGNKLGTTGILLLHAEGVARNSIGSGATIGFRGYLGSSAVLMSHPIGNNFNSKWEVDWRIYADGSTSLQEAFLRTVLDNAADRLNSSETFAEDTTGDLTVKLTAQWPVASSTLGITMQRYYAILYS